MDAGPGGAPGAGRRALVTAGAALLALAAAVPSYFVGPNSAYTSIIALALIAAGARVGDPDRSGAAGAFLVYLAAASGQAVVCALILTRTLPDRGLVPVWVGSHAGWEHASAHVFVQTVYLAAFLGGRWLRRRYRALAAQIEEATRSAARREALLDEARAEYRRALMVGRRGWFAGAGGAAPARRSGTAPPELDSAAIAPERLDAPDLAACLRASGPLPRDELRALVEDVSRALEAIHGGGQVHLDVRPRTICRVDGAGRASWRLLDAAAAQVEAARDPGRDPAAILAYAAPERLRGAHAGAPADLYGLAASLYAAVTGCDPFDGGEAVLRAAGGAGAPRDPRRVAPTAPVADDVASALRIGLATAPDDRFASPGELRRAFLAALDGRLDAGLRAAAKQLEARDPWRPAGRAGPNAAAPAPGIAAPSQAAGRAGPNAAAPAPGIAAPDPAGPRAASAPSQAGPNAALSAPTASPTSAGPAVPGEPASAAWHRAYVAMMRGFCFSVTALCAFGAAYFWLIADDRVLLRFAWACLIAIAVVAWWHWFLIRNRPGQTVVWPWVVAAGLTVGPALSIGLHCGFAAIVTVLVFVGGMFRGPARGEAADRRVLVITGLCVAHTIAFALIATGVIGDTGNVPVLPRGISPGDGAIRHLFVLACYAAGFAAGRAIDRRHESLSREVEAAARDAARDEALLVSAREEIDRALAGESGGLFSRLRLGGYELGRLLGRGGVGEVYEARHMASGALVALKLLRRDRAGEAWHAGRLRSEATALRRVESAHVARIVDGGDLDGEIPFVAMEFIQGTSLAALLRERPAIDAATVGELVSDVAAGLEDVHRAGVLHLDIKPSNLIRGAAGWQLVDFGTAQLASAGDALRLVSGTPSYMSPEQALGAPLDARSDLYSFTLVLYRALTGRPAFSVREPAEVDTAAAAGPPDPRAHADLSRDLELVLRIGLAVRCDDRFASAGELRDAFAAALQGELPARLRRRGSELLARAPWRLRETVGRRRSSA